MVGSFQREDLTFKYSLLPPTPQRGESALEGWGRHNQPSLGWGQRLAPDAWGMQVTHVHVHVHVMWVGEVGRGVLGSGMVGNDTGLRI